MEKQNNQPLIVILGPTASGKTKLAVNVASKINGEIISADSRQVYRGMNIGTGKDYEEYLPFFKQNQDWLAGIEGIHLIDIVKAGNSYNVAFFQRDFQKAYQDIISRNKTPILCGGTGMYIEAVLRNYENTQVPINQDFRTELSLKTDEELEQVFQKKYAQVNSNADISTRKRLIRAIEIGEFKTREVGGRRSAFEIWNMRIFFNKLKKNLSRILVKITIDYFGEQSEYCEINVNCDTHNVPQLVFRLNFLSEKLFDFSGKNLVLLRF